MAPEALSADNSISSENPASSSMVQTPSTPSIWSVSHATLDQAQAKRTITAGPASSFELVTDVNFVWSYPAKSAFVTGTFSNWETTDRMTQIHGLDGPVWALSKALRPGEYQYKFIIDNVWRHAPDQQITFDERGIINNVLSVTVDACGEPTCFCSKIFGNATTNALDTATTKARNMQLRKGIMTPQTMKRFQRRIGVASYYVEHDIGKSYQFRKGYMHTEISDRPFDVTVVNVNNIKGRLVSVYKPTEGTISRASSFEHIILEQDAARLDSDVPVVEDAAYAAVLNDQDGSLPHTAPYRAYALSGDPTELAYSLRARLSSPVLGFNPKECHEGIRLLDTNHCAVRVQERGLYKSVRCALPLRTDRRRMYYEFFVLRQSTGGGVCLGLSTKELPLNCLCGTRPNSIGFCTSGSLIRTVDGKETWTAFGSDVGSGSTIGCLVGLEKVHFESKTIIKANVQFFVDGNSRGNVDHEFVGDLDIYPTLSLFAKNTRVYLFNGPDMLFASCLQVDEDVVTLDNRKIVRDAGNNPQSLSLANQAKKTDSPLSGEFETT